MKFKADENVPYEVVCGLREAGHDAVNVTEQRMGGSPDDDLLAVCRTEGRALVTLDLDFSDVRSYPPENTHGIIVFRPRFQSIGSIENLLRRLLALMMKERLEGRLWIVEEHQVRIRGANE